MKIQEIYGKKKKTHTHTQTVFLMNTSRPHQYRLGINWHYFLPA